MASIEHVTVLNSGIQQWNSWRQENPNIVPDLSRMEFSIERTRRPDLSIDLFRAPGDQAVWTALTGIRLIGADLHETSFERTLLPWADLTGANLRGANLVGADLTGAVLGNADLAGARVGMTKFGRIDLSMTKGLEECAHQGPSTIGIDTIYLSGGKIPDVFLRGAGVPENFITYASSLVGNPIDFYSCFISYSHADKAFARRLHDALQGRGIRCWLDEHQLFPGDDIHDQIDRGIRLWDKVLLCFSKSTVSSWWVNNEINKAFTKEQGLMKQRGKKTLALIPLDLDGTLKSWQDSKADEIQRRMAADFTGWDSNHAKCEAQIERVVEALRADDGGHEAPPAPRL